MPKTYLVEFTVTLIATRSIEAADEEQALRIAGELQENDRYREGLVESWDDPFAGWGDPHEPKVLVAYEDGEPEYSREDYLDYYAYEYPEV